VPPIVSSVSPVRRSGIALINLGGLQNPFWPWKIPVAYAEAVISASRAVVPIDFPLEIATSESIAERLAVSDVGCRMTQEMPVLMSRSALMTAGLGNLYEAANYKLPTVWLPPAKGSNCSGSAVRVSRTAAPIGLIWASR